MKRIWELVIGECGVCLRDRSPDDLHVGTYYDWRGDVFVIQLECSFCRTVIADELARLRATEGRRSR